jgi:hypothetical protein
MIIVFQLIWYSPPTASDSKGTAARVEVPPRQGWACHGDNVPRRLPIEGSATSFLAGCQSRVANSILTPQSFLAGGRRSSQTPASSRELPCALPGRDRETTWRTQRRTPLRPASSRDLLPPLANSPCALRPTCVAGYVQAPMGLGSACVHRGLLDAFRRDITKEPTNDPLSPGATTNDLFFYIAKEGPHNF